MLSKNSTMRAWKSYIILAILCIKLSHKWRDFICEKNYILKTICTDRIRMLGTIILGDNGYDQILERNIFGN